MENKDQKNVPSNPPAKASEKNNLSQKDHEEAEKHFCGRK
jgi:hypothetical protein